MDAVYKAAAKRPEDRWPTAGVFVDALESSIGSASVGAGVTTDAILPAAAVAT